MRSVAGVALLLLALMACGTPSTEVATVDKAQAKAEAERQVAEAEAFALDAQRAIDQAEAAVREAERVAAEQKARAAAEAAADAARRKAAARAARSAPRAAPSGAGVWDRLAACESGGRWNINTGNGYYGGLQMDMSFWRSYGGGVAARPDLASREQQIAAATRARDGGRGYHPWPKCARRLGLI